MIGAVEGVSYTFGTGEEDWEGKVSEFMAEDIYRAMLDAAPQEQRFTCIGKGGVYERIGTAEGAGTHRESDDLVVYREVSTGRLWYRTWADFIERMQPLDTEGVVK